MALTKGETDLAQLDSDTAKFDQIVDTVDVLERAIGKHPDQISGVVQYLRRFFVPDVLRLGDILLIQVARRKLRSTQRQFTDGILHHHLLVACDKH